jgi:hypothetical protein
MSDTIGDMVDKLTIANIRLWMLEDARREYCNTSESKTEEEIKDFLNKVSKTNRERNSLIDQINCAFKVLIDTTTGLQSEMTLTADDLLGTGKNKFYKTEDT